MTGPYLIGVDGGTQSSKVVVYDATGAVALGGPPGAQPMRRPRPGVAVHPVDDLWDSIAAASREALAGFDGDPAEIAGVGLCTIRCCKAFLRADGSLWEPVISWMDDRAYQPYRRRPRGHLRDDLLGLPHPPLHGRAQGQRRQQHPAAVADRHRHMAVDRRSRALRAVQRAAGDARRAAAAG